MHAINRFEPASKKELYAVEFQTYQKRGNEGRAELAENLKSLADKAYKELGDDAKELLALNQYLKLLTDPQIAFAVRQQKPKNLDEAVTATLRNIYEATHESYHWHFKPPRGS